MFRFPVYVKEMEKQKKWSEVLGALYKDWAAKKDDLNLLLCIGSELWYCLEFGDEHEMSHMIDKQKAKCQLDEVFSFGSTFFSEEYTFNLFFGYMISLFPYFFNGDFDEMQQKAKEMLRKACELEPNNPVPRIWYYGSHSNHPLYKTAKQEAYESVCLLFPKNGTAVENYMRDMLLP